MSTATQASFQVLISRPLFYGIVAFIPGVPHFVRASKIQVVDEISRLLPWKERSLWQAAVRHKNRRVLSALYSLSKVERYASNLQV